MEVHLVKPDGTVEYLQSDGAGSALVKTDISDRAARLLGVIYGSQGEQLLQRATTFDQLIQLRHDGAEIDPRAITQWGGTALTGRDISGDLANLDVTLTNLAKLKRWGRQIEPTWVHAAEQTAPGAGAALITKAVPAGKTGYIYGFLISAQEANDFKINWTSGTVTKSKRIVFGGAGSTECVDPTPLNEGLPADASTNITITNITAAAAGKIYQADLLYGEV